MSSSSEEVGGGMVERAVRVFLLTDTSYSMEGARINTLNAAMDEVIPVLRDSEDENSRGTIEVQAIAFSSGARWVNQSPVNVHDYKWTPLTADGVTDMGEGFNKLADALTESAMPANSFPPVIVLITDGAPTDNYQAGLQKLNQQRWARAAVRCAISVGQGTDETVLREFLGNSEFPLLSANNVEDLKKYIKYATVALSQMSSQGQSEAVDDGGDTKAHVPPPPPPIDPSSLPDDDVW